MTGFTSFVLGGITVGSFGLGLYAGLAALNGWVFPSWVLWWNLGLVCLAISRRTFWLMWNYEKIMGELAKDEKDLDGE